MRFSFLSLAAQALRGHRGWPQQWRSPEPKKAYDAVIVGAGGHGLATAYYMAKEHGLRNTAVLEKGWLGGGNTGRNTYWGPSFYNTDLSLLKKVQIHESIEAQFRFDAYNAVNHINPGNPGGNVTSDGTIGGEAPGPGPRQLEFSFRLQF